MNGFWWVAAYKIEGVKSRRITSCFVEAICEQHAINEGKRRLADLVNKGCVIIAREVPNADIKEKAQ
jgi:hypothetical protein